MNDNLSVLVRDQDTALARAHEEGMVGVADVQLARTLGRLFGCPDDLFALTAALAFAAVRAGSSVLDLDQAADLFADVALQGSDLGPAELVQARRELQERLAWPEPAPWADHLAGLTAVGDATSEPNTVPLRLVGHTAYLERYWLSEELIAELLHERQTLPPPTVDADRLTASLARIFHTNDDRQTSQQLAVERAIRSRTSVLAGGPGTGKTYTVARVLSALQDQSPDRRLRVAMAAPSGKAASRLTQSVTDQVSELEGHLPDLSAGRTLHNLLGARGLTGLYRHGPLNPLPHDVVVVDEVSMVDLHQFGVLLSAIRPSTRLLLVGDPQQLKSVNAGSVLADITTSGLTLGGGSTESAVTELTAGWRNEGDIHNLAQAMRGRDADTALAVLDGDSPQVQLLDTPIDRTTTWDTFGPVRDQVLQQWQDVLASAEAGDASGALAALDRHRVLCGHREGFHGVSAWSSHTLQLVRSRRPGFGAGGEFYPGRPVILTVNDKVLDLSNGDTGVIINDGGQRRVALGDADHHRVLSPALLRGVDSVFAMTVHKAQGSQFDRVTVVLPPLGSPLLTRDLVYTAVTRARQHVTLIGSKEQLRAAILTEPRRASGLASRWRLQGAVEPGIDEPASQ